MRPQRPFQKAAVDNGPTAVPDRIGMLLHVCRARCGSSELVAARTPIAGYFILAIRVTAAKTLSQDCGTGL